MASCHLKTQKGRAICLDDCPAVASPGVFHYARVERPEGLPPPDGRGIDVAVLDMNHGWPNLGHDSLVQAVRDAACDLLPSLEPAGLYLRAISFDVRRTANLPERPGGRFSIYIGTGGPGHIDPHQNDGTSAGTQGIHENPFWEKPLFALFDAILADPDAALLAVCHSFGILCRWSGAARPVLRGPDKGKSSGILENILTLEATAHPWFRRFSEALPDRRRLRIVDNRLYDLIPTATQPPGVVPIGFETCGVGGPPGEAVTMLEFARERGGVMPRVFAVNHHPEIVDRPQQLMILRQKLERGEVSRAWYHERERLLTQTHPEEDSEARIHLTSDYTFLTPLRFYLYREVRRRMEALGLAAAIDERDLLKAPDARAAS